MSSDLPYRPSNRQSVLNRADDVSNLLNAVQDVLIPFIRSADEDAGTKETGHGLAVEGGGPRTSLVEYHKPQKLAQLLELQLPEEGLGQPGLLEFLAKLLQYSVNTWDQGFLSKLYSSTDAPGVASELILSVLNTALHVYQVSPALTLIEKTTSRALANLFGLNGPHAGGISVPGGSASNTTSIVIARNTLFPATKEHGNSAAPGQLVLFTSAHGHYSLTQAAQQLGLGSSSVIIIVVDTSGRMVPSVLEDAITTAKQSGKTPFYVNATAGTTVLGSYDPIALVAPICRAHNLWLHVDASWGGPAIFSPAHAHKLTGTSHADSIAINPHKMLGVPVTCSFLLGADTRKFHASNTVPDAHYLFHGAAGAEVYDLAALTLQCGRRGDSLKLYLSWLYHGSAGYAALVSSAFDTAAYLATLVSDSPDLVLVSENPPPCLQVCFYYARGGSAAGTEETGRVTRGVVARLVREGWMIDFARGEAGEMFRVVVNRETRRGTVEGLVRAVAEGGRGMGEGADAGGEEVR